MQVIGKIYRTRNYSKFKRLENNRDLYDSRVKKLIASLSVKSVLNPIIVNEKFEIIDGQGRYEAKKRLGMPIDFIVAEGTDISDCIRMNRYNSKWSDTDFIKSYSDAGNSNYKRLYEMMEETGYGAKMLLRLVNQATHKHERCELSKVQSGELIFTDNDCDVIRMVKKCIDDVVDALAYTGRINSSFKTAIKIMIDTEGYDHKVMIQNCRKNRSSFVQMARTSDQLKEFERIYNYKKQAKHRIYFTDYMRNRGFNVRDYSKDYVNLLNQEDVSTLEAIR